jgi:hypothetical protein
MGAIYPLTAIIASLALLAVAGSPTTAESSTAHIACTHDVSATIGGHHKCLGVKDHENSGLSENLCKWPCWLLSSRLYCVAVSLSP